MKMLESRINSVELCELINRLRKEEKGEDAKVLRHDSLMAKIRKELETMEKLGLGGDQNILESSYINSQNKEQPCFSLNASGMRQILNSESVYVRCKTEEYITNLEEKNKQLQQSAKTPDIMIAEAMQKLVENQNRHDEKIFKLIENQQKMTEKIGVITDQIKDITENYKMLCVITDGQWESKKKISSFNGGLPSIKKIVEGTGITPGDANKILIEKGILNKDKSPTEESINKGLCEPDYYDGKCYARYTTKGQKIVREILGIEEVEQTTLDNVIEFKK